MAKRPEYEVEDWETAYNNARTDQEKAKAIKDYEDAKLRNAERREQYRLDKAVENGQRRKAKFKKATSSMKGWWDKLMAKLSQRSK